MKFNMLIRSCIPSLFFFFQAEDGIRDLYVTGVQTCALPISEEPRHLRVVAAHHAGEVDDQHTVLHVLDDQAVDLLEIGRACVGKECRSRWSPYHEKKKSNKKRIEPVLARI